MPEGLQLVLHSIIMSVCNQIAISDFLYRGVSSTGGPRMYTSFGILALAGSMLGPIPTTSPDLVWWRDYYVARGRAVTDQKPLAVFVGAGLGGYHHLTKEGQLDDSVKKVLADHYVCVYLDTASPSQEGLIKDLAVTKGTGLVLSDRTGNLQAFHHDGQIARADLAKQLQRFADPTVEVHTTLTNTSQRYSYYPAGSSSPRAAVYAPARLTISC
jgi:hypothetical protein